MKKMKNIAALILLCVFMSLSLTGCTALFDVLNFNRQPLPNTESKVEQGLENPYKTGDTIKKEELPQIFSLADAEFFEDSLTITARPNYHSSVDRYYEYFYSLDATVTDREGQEELPYAAFTETSMYYYYGANNYSESHYFYDDYFISTEYTRKFSIDEYIEKIGLTSYDIISNGGLLSKLVYIFADNLDSACYGYTNGKKSIAVTLEAEAKVALEELLPKSYDASYYYGAFKGLGTLEIILDDDAVTGKISYKLQDGYLMFEFSRKYVDIEPIVAITSYSDFLPSYTYSILNAAKKYNNPISYETIDLLEFKTAINYYMYGEERELNFYHFANKFCTSKNYVSQNIKLIELEKENIYYVAGSLEYIFVEKDDGVAVCINNLREEYDEYSSQLSYIEQNILGDMKNFSYNSSEWGDITYTIDETDNGYKISIQYIEKNYDNDAEAYVVTFTKTSVFEITKDFSKLLGYEFEVISNGEIRQSIEVEFSYDFEVNVPFAAADLHKYY